jgi:hypothetical protein
MIANERITQRLQCLAMGVVLSSTAKKSGMTHPTTSTTETQHAPDTRRSPAGLGSNGAVLQAARDYAKYRHDKNLQRRVPEALCDLTKPPIVCVGAPRTTCRDDAVSVRPRRATGTNGKASVSSDVCPREIITATSSQ